MRRGNDTSPTIVRHFGVRNATAGLHDSIMDMRMRVWYQNGNCRKGDGRATLSTDTYMKGRCR